MSKIILHIVELWLASSFMFLTGSRVGELSLLLSFAMFFAYIMKSTDKKRKGVVILLFLIIGTSYVLQPYMKDIINKTNSIIGHPIEFPCDDFKLPENLSEMTVLAADKTNNTNYFEKIVYNPTVTKFLTGRNLYWMGYLRNMNFLGHHFYPLIWGDRRTPHNGILGVSYMYGILIAVPYLYMFLNSIGLSFFKMANKKENIYSFFTYGICMITMCFMLVENIERPFLATEWIVFYLILGSLFPNCDEKMASEGCRS